MPLSTESERRLLQKVILQKVHQTQQEHESTAAVPGETKLDKAETKVAPLEQGITRQMLSILGQAYNVAKTKIPLPDSAAANLQKIEEFASKNAPLELVADAIDGRISSSLEFVRTETSKRHAAAWSRVDELANKPVVKDLVSPVTAAVVGGFLGAGDVIVDFALPEEAAAAGETKGESPAAAKDAETSALVPQARELATKLRSRLRKRASDGLALLQQKREDALTTRVDLIAYAKSFLGTKQLQQAVVTDKLQMKNMQQFAAAVMEPYRQQLKGQWDAKVQPVFLAVTDYGEYFMENVKGYEKRSKGEKDAGLGKLETENAVNRFISQIAHRFVEPTLVRTVAVFMVLGDEMRRLKVQEIEPRVTVAMSSAQGRAGAVATKVEEKVQAAAGLVSANTPSSVAWAAGEAQRVVAQVYETLNAQYTVGLQRFDGKRVRLEEFRAAMASQVVAEFDSIVSPVRAKVFEAIQAMPWAGPDPVTLEAFKAKAVERLGQEYAHYEAAIAPLLQRIHAGIVAVEEWATPWYRSIVERANMSAATQQSQEKSL